MNRSLLWRGLLILAVAVLSVVFVYPPDEKINLGLDLRGGMHLVLQVLTADALRAETSSDMDILLRAAEDEGVTGLSGNRTGDTTFEITGATGEAADTVVEVVGDRFEGWEVSRQGGRLVVSMTEQRQADVRRQAVRQAVETIRNRVDEFGVTEPVIAEAGNDRILVQLPGVDDPERVRRLIKNTAFLEFRLVDQRGMPAPSREALLERYGGQLPPDLEILQGGERDAQAAGDSYYAVQKRPIITGRDLKMARQGLGQFQEPVVNFSVNASAAESFGETTGENIGTPMAMVLDRRVISAPTIQARITDSGVIEGQFDQQEAEDLATLLRSGALPAGIDYLEERTVGPSLGRDSIEQGLRAGLVGSVCVVLFILIIYNLSGLNAVAALVLNILLLFGGLGLFNATLTLPGIAGIILTIGMAVDANVLVFERIREELRAGRTVKSAIDLGFEKALSSIVDSNVTTLIAALFLFQFGTGPIKGFAVTLSIGLLSSMFTAIFVSRWLFDLVLSQRRVQRLSI